MKMNIELGTPTFNIEFPTAPKEIKTSIIVGGKVVDSYTVTYPITCTNINFPAATILYSLDYQKE